jgi:transposase-like protein
VIAALKPVYTAVNVEAAADALDTFELTYGDRYPGIVAVWRAGWERFIRACQVLCVREDPWYLVASNGIREEAG